MLSDLLGLSRPWLDQLVDGQDLGNGFYACFQGMTPLRWLIFGSATTGVLLCLYLLLVNAAVEAALSTINRMSLQSMLERHERRVLVIQQLLDRPNQVLSAISTLNIICLILATALTITAIHQFNLYGFEVTVLVLILTLLILSLVRTVPKGFALHEPEAVAVRFSGFVNVETALFSPLVQLINFVSNLVLRLANRPPIPANTIVTEEELTLLANVAEEEGVIQDEEREMIRSIFEFGGTIVREVMVPRLDIRAIPLHSSLDDALDLILKSGHSRLPVYREDIDHVVGILYAKDLLRYLRYREEQLPFELEKLLRPIYYVPESKKVDELFNELQNKRVHITIIIDEYGGTAGLVTIEDLLEEIVGEIEDEYDLQTSHFERIHENEVLLDARLNLSDANEFFNTHWESENVDTIGGFIYDKLERIPMIGDQLIVDQMGAEVDPKELATEEPLTPYFCLSVMTVNGQRLKQLRLERKLPDPPPSEATDPNLELPVTSNPKRSGKNRDKDRDKEPEPPLLPKESDTLPPPLGFASKEVKEGELSPP
ncbi:MAG: HlyC/CorC family transporter [Chloroflexi bacterium]|nr:HlyC/CorC family transporter [Chloroflexota bacterium]